MERTYKDQNMEGPSQKKSIPDRGQIKNSAGGYVWGVDDMTRFRRFLVLGSENGTYYINETKLGVENAEALGRLIEEGRGEEVVEMIEEYSVQGRVAKQNPLLFALAYCARNKDLKTKRKAYEVLNRVCRIPTHLFAFIEYCQNLSHPATGWGRAHRKAICRWYTSQSPKKLAMAVTKYRNREGWRHADVLRLAHPKAEDEGMACVLMYLIKGIDVAMDTYFKEEMPKNVEKALWLLKAVEDVKLMTNPGDVAGHIYEYGLVREHIPTPLLSSNEVWEALLVKMPITAMIRNLGKMTQIGVLEHGNHYSALVCGYLKDDETLKKARIHPFNVLVALKQYSCGRGLKGRLAWDPVQEIVGALEDAFYSSFKFVEPTNKRFLLAIDVSGSMSAGSCNGSASITPRMAAAAMSLVTARTEKDHHFVAFTHKLKPLDITPDMKLDAVINEISRLPFGPTDCAQPMLYAKANSLKIDVFIVYTDCETWAGHTHPSQALKSYRKASKIPDAKLIVCGMTSNGFTIADPEDRGMLDMVGFDSAAPHIIRSFVNDEL